MGMEIVRQMLAIGLVLGLLGAAVWALGRRGAARPFLRRGSGDGPIEAAARLTLSPTHSLHLVRVRGRELLIAVHPGGCTLLGDDRAAGDGGKP
jgi:flagellar biogenesis protein FliO